MKILSLQRIILIVTLLVSQYSIVSAQLSALWATNDQTGVSGSHAQLDMSTTDLNESAKGFVTDANNNIYVVGTYGRHGNGIDASSIFLYKLDPSGAVVWKRGIYAPYSRINITNPKIAIGDEGIYIMAGTEYTPPANYPVSADPDNTVNSGGGGIDALSDEDKQNYSWAYQSVIACGDGCCETSPGVWDCNPATCNCDCNGTTGPGDPDQCGERDPGRNYHAFFISGQGGSLDLGSGGYSGTAGALGADDAGYIGYAFDVKTVGIVFKFDINTGDYLAFNSIKRRGNRKTTEFKPIDLVVKRSGGAPDDKLVASFIFNYTIDFYDSNDPARLQNIPAVCGGGTGRGESDDLNLGVVLFDGDLSSNITNQRTFLFEEDGGAGGGSQTGDESAITSMSSIFEGGLGINNGKVFLSGTFYAQSGTTIEIHHDDDKEGCYNSGTDYDIASEDITAGSSSRYVGYLMQLSLSDLTYDGTQFYHNNNCSYYGRDILVKGNRVFLLLEGSGGSTAALTYDFESPTTTYTSYTVNIGSELSSAGLDYFDFGVLTEVNTSQLDGTPTLKWLSVMAMNSEAYSMDFPPGVSLGFDRSQTGIYVNGNNYAGTGVIKKLYWSNRLAGTNNTLFTTPPLTAGSDYLMDEGEANSQRRDIMVFKMPIGGASPNCCNSTTVYGAVLGGTGNDYAYGIKEDAAGNTIIAGAFSGQTDVDPTPSTFQLLAVGGQDAFVAKYGCYGGRIQTSPLPVGCSGDPVTIIAEPDCDDCVYDYQWTLLGTSNTGTGPEFTITQTQGIYNVELDLEVTGSGCGRVRDTIAVEIKPAISLNLTSTSETVCEGDSATFQATILPTGLPNTTYNWFNSTTDNLEGSGSVFKTVVPGSYFVNASADGCETTASVAVSNFPSVSPVLFPNNPTLCGNSGVKIQVLDCPGCGYSWTPPPGSAASSSNNEIIADIPGTYTVNILDQYGCVKSLLSTVVADTFLTPPVYALDANGNTANGFCDGTSLTIYSTSYDECPTCTYQWNDGSTGPYTFASTAGTFSVTVENTLSGCRGVSTDLVLTNSSLPSPTASALPSTICSPNFAELSLDNPCVGCTYAWYENEPTSAVLSTTTELTIANLEEQDGACFPDYDTVNINDDRVIPDGTWTQLPASFRYDDLSGVIPIGFSFDFYCNSKTDLRVSSNGFVTFDLASNVTGSFMSRDLPGSTSPNDIIAMFWARYMYVNGYAGTGPVRYKTEGTTPGSRIFLLDFESARDLYSGRYVTFQLKLFEADNTIEIHTTSVPSPPYLNPAFYAGVTQGLEDASGIVTTINKGRNQTIWNITAPEAVRFVPKTVSNIGTIPYGDYYISVTDSGGCTAISNIISVNADTISRPIIITTANILCDDGSGSFTNTATLSTINCTGCSYQWYKDDSLISGATAYQYIAANLGTYSVEVTFDNTCSAFSSNVVTLSDDIFTPQIGPQDTVYICNGTPVTMGLVGSFQVSPTWSFQWYRNSVAITGATGYNYDATTPGFYYVMVTNANGCVSESNVIRVLSSSDGANPVITSSFPYLCSGNSDTIELSVSTCPSCSYDWRNASGVSQIAQDTNTFLTSVPQGYIVRVIDTVSSCFYDSPVFEIKDTTYPAPTINALSSVVCSTTPVVISTNSCIGCEYEWSLNNLTIGTTTVNNFSATQNGNYTLTIYRGECPSPVSNDIPVTFVSVNAVVSATPSTATSICNGDSVLFEADPVLSACTTCDYQWFRDNVQLPSTDSTLLVLQGGSYELVITDAGGCTDTSLIRSLVDVSLATDLQATATAICGAVGIDTLSVEGCSGCSFDWFYDGDTSIASGGGINLSSLGQADTFYIVNGGAASGLYQVEVEISGCVVTDQIYLPLITPLDVNISPNPVHATICDGAPVQLTALSTPVSRPLRYQWYYNNAILPGAITQTNLATVGGDYEVHAIDTFGCFDYSGNLNVGEIDPAPGFLLDFDSVSVIPLSHPNIDITDYVTPSSVYGMGTDTIYSVPQPTAVITDSFYTMQAGPGQHFVTFEYEDAPCIFSVRDTIDVLSQMDLDVVNQNPVAPPYESCLNDDLEFYLTNFTFAPNQILFSTSATTYDTLALSPAQVNLTSTAGVWTGIVDVMVPLGAVTGKVILRDSITGEFYQSQFFLVVQNPSVAISLNGVQQPLCSNDDTISLTGFPLPGTFKAAYAATPTVYEPTLINGSDLVVENVINYDPFTRTQNLELTYVYWPTYSNVISIGAAAQCPDSVVAILPVQVNNNELDSVVYTPISETQAVVPMADMTKGIYPLLNRNFPGNYIGTYVTNNNLLASTVPMPPAVTSVTDPIIYTFSNQSCSNSVSENVEIWARPSILDSIPEWICRTPDTVFIGRNASGLFATVAGNTTPIIDGNYALLNQIVSLGARDYQEKINVLTINSTNGGLYTMPSSTPGNELYAFLPDSVQGGSTTITLEFGYERNGSYYIPTNSPDVVNYTIASVQRVINIEDPFVTEISPAILADTIFCQDNQTQQFSGSPLGGQYYINGDSLISNIFNPNQIAAAYNPITEHELIYIYTGNACVDADTAIINVPDTFSVSIFAPNGPDYCRLDPADTISVNSSNPGVIDSTIGIFYVNYAASGQIFNPAISPAILNGNSVFYIASDTFGCQVSSDTVIFNVNPMPSISMTPLDPAYCLNAPADPFMIYEDTLFGPGFIWDNTLGYTGTYANIQVTLAGNGILPGDASNPASPTYNPATAGVGHDTVHYTFENTLTGCSTTIEETTFVKALPQLGLFTYDANNDSVALSNTYCEYDTISIGISPIANPATDSIFSYYLATSNWSPSFDTIFGGPHFAPIVDDINDVTVTEILAYTYFDQLTGCRDTIADTITVRNMTTDLAIVGFPANDTICANDLVTDLDTAILAQNPTVTAFNAGVYSTLYPSDTSTIVDSLNGGFNPYLSGVFDTGRDVIVSYTYEVNGCTNYILDTVFVNPVPQLSYLQVLNPDVQAPLVDNMIGDSLFNSSDPLPHICFSAEPIQMVIQNQFNGSMTQVNSTGYAGPPDTTITGWFDTYSGMGVVYDTAIGVWYYDTLRATGMDTLYFTYKNNYGCVNTLTVPVFIDSVPELGFAGYQGNYLGVNDEDGLIHEYCENEPSHLLIPTPFGGSTYWNYNPIPSILFELRPDTLVENGVPTFHRLTYEFISARYEHGAVCLDSIVDSILIKPTPVLNMSASVPDFYCVSNENQRVPLFAIPSGGYFEDATLGVIAGIVGDTLFVPSAQMGTREIYYVYSDTVSGNLTGCSDTLVHFIDVYNMPDVGFETGGGCEGDTILFIPDNMNLSSVFPAIDSITMIVWNYGDGQIDSLVDSTLNLVNPIVVPNQDHIYTTTGVYYPSLTVVNRDGCDTTFSKRIVVSPKFVALDTTPYFQDFENGPASWFQENGDSAIYLPTDSLWVWGMATGSTIETASDANHVWATAPTGTYPQGEKAWVYSPCFDISDLDRPMVAMDIWRDTREGVDGVVLQYFDEPSATWKPLGKRGKGINWYNPSYVISAPGYQVGAPIGWSGSSPVVGGLGWEDARYRLDVSGGDLRFRDNLRFRIAFASTANSVVGNLEGFAFDNFYLGNRQRSVLVEHFSNQNYANIDVIETALYNEIYTNLYGRDVNLIQFHVLDNGADFLHQQASADNSARDSYYGITSGNQVRVNGQPLVSTTDSLINNALEILDMQMLTDAKYKIEEPDVTITVAENKVEITANVIPLQNLPVGDYRAFTVITEDSIVSILNHQTMAVMRKILPDPGGDTLLSEPLAYIDSFLIDHEWIYDPNIYNPNNLEVVFFVQNNVTKEVYQVATTRNLNIFDGPVSVDDLEDKDGLELLSLKLFPNPTQNQFFVEFSQHLQSEYDWQVVDVTGRVLKSGVAMPGTRRMEVETNNFSPGMYIFTIKNENVRIQRKVIIAR